MASNKLFVEKTIDIHAAVPKVWDALTLPHLTKKWIKKFSRSFSILESYWNLGSSVLWKGDDGTVYVDGIVTAVNPNSLLRYTAHDVKDDSKAKLDLDAEDGITFTLVPINGITKLSVRHGDFGKIKENGEKYHIATDAIWDRVLPIIREIAEKHL